MTNCNRKLQLQNMRKTREKPREIHNGMHQKHDPEKHAQDVRGRVLDAQGMHVPPHQKRNEERSPSARRIFLPSIVWQGAIGESRGGTAPFPSQKDEKPAGRAKQNCPPAPTTPIPDQLKDWIRQREHIEGITKFQFTEVLKIPMNGENQKIQGRYLQASFQRICNARDCGLIANFWQGPDHTSQDSFSEIKLDHLISLLPLAFK